jgi:pyruvate dehydrogenase E2 component (dihydrolipoamide acetyltransferase)
MATDVVMPQMGESIFEGTVTKWLKKPGDTVERDEPLFEISTDKVDAEIPSPVAGTLQEIKVEAGATVQVNAIVAVISEAAGAAAAAPAEAKAEPQAKAQADAPNAETAPSAATEVVMPQMGESIFEGTITKWLKKVGDKVERDEPLFEISTDKVDAEIPSPVAGVLQEIRSEAGATVQVNTTVALIGGGAAPAKSAPAPSAPVAESKPAAQSAVPAQPPAEAVPQGGEKVRSSPLVRKMAKEHDLDLSRIAGSGSAGRVTRDDVLSHLSGNPAAASTPTPAAAGFPLRCSLQQRLLRHQHPPLRRRPLRPQQQARSLGRLCR